jgi:hypothetical protein
VYNTTTLRTNTIKMTQCEGMRPSMAKTYIGLILLFKNTAAFDGSQAQVYLFNALLAHKHITS